MQQTELSHPTPPSREIAYDAFISYSHAADREMAKSLQIVLQRLGRPWYRRYALRVFRDDTALAASPNLWESIERALLMSRNFVLLASPEAASSEWVAREIGLWQQRRSTKSFLIVLTTGDLVWSREAGDFNWERTTALPKQLRGWFQAEPLWLDLRKDRGLAQRKIRRRRDFRGKVAAVAAAIHGVAKDELLSEELRQQRRLIMILSTLLVLVFVAGVMAVWQRNTAVAERDRANTQARIALSRSVAAESEIRSQSDPRLGAQLALAAYDTSPTPEAKAALLRQLDRNQHIVKYIRRGTDQRSTQTAASAPTQAYTALSADGTLLAYANVGEEDVVLWDTHTNREVRRLHIASPPELINFFTPVHGLALDHAGRVIAVDDGLRVQIWDVQTGTLLRVIEHGNRGFRVALSPGARWVARIHDPRYVEDESTLLRVWQVDTGNELPVTTSGTIRWDQVTFTSDDKLHVQFEDGLRTLDLSTGQWSLTVPVAPDAPVSFAMARSVPRLAFATASGIELWDSATGRKIVSYQKTWDATEWDATGVSELVASADGEVAAVGTYDGRVITLNTGTGKFTELLQHRSAIRGLSVTDDGSMVASTDVSGDVVLATQSDNRILSTTQANSTQVSAIAVDQRGDLAIVGRDGGVELWELPALRLQKRLHISVRSAIPTVAINQDGSMAAVRDDDLVSVIDTRSGQVISTMQLEDKYTLEGTEGVRFLPAGNGLLVDTVGGPQVIDPQHDTKGQQLNTNDKGGGFASSSDGKTVAAVIQNSAAVMQNPSAAVIQNLGPLTGGSEVALWRWQDARYQLVKVIKENSNIRDIALDTEGSRIAMVDVDGRVLLIDLESGRHRVLAAPGVGSYGQLGFTPDSTILVQSDDLLGGIVLWDADAGVLLDTWQHPASVDQRNESDSAVAVGPHGQVLAVRPDHGLVLWQIDLDAAHDQLCRLAGDLAAEQREQYLIGVDVQPSCSL